VLATLRLEGGSHRDEPPDEPGQDTTMNEHHVISTTEGQVWLVAAEYDGQRRSARDAGDIVREQHGEGEPDFIYYEGLLSDAVQGANRDGIELLRD